MDNLKKTQFHITYPENDTLDESPVVFLFGWMGARDKYLRVYSEIYEQKGFPTVRLTVSPIVVLFKNNEMAGFSLKLIELLEQPNMKGRPIVFHLFSNGGTFQYEIFMKFLDESKRKLVKGVIIDSGPTKFTLHGSFSVCNTIFGSVVTNRVLLYPLTAIVIACLAVGLTAKKILRYVLRMPVHMMDPYNNLINQKNICPQLFIYSKADNLVPYKELEKFIERRKALGVDVTTKLYENTQHSILCYRMVPQRVWEYHTTKLSENFDYGNLKVPPEEKFCIRDRENVPVVIIFGWSGALDRYLKSYAKIYEERGLNTIRYTTPAKYIFYRSNMMVKIGEEMAQTFLEQKFNKNPIIIHALSNGGCYQYEVFMRGLNKTSQRNEVKGMIFDSCPVRRGPFGLYQAIKANVDSKYFKAPISFYLTYYAMLKRTTEMHIADITKKECVQMNPYQNLLDEKYRWPQHFIYSTKDIIVDLTSVESFADHRKSLGVEVTMKLYENSAHVQHYVKNRSSYVRSVVKFVNKCLRK